MAFMMPVMKNNYDIYKDNSRSRKTSECSNGSASSAPPLTIGASVSAPGRSSATHKSESFSSSSPSHTYRIQMQRCQSSKAFPRSSSRSSQATTSATLSPTRSFCQQPASTSPPKGASADKQEMSKFHLRLVDKLRKSFRKDSAKRS